MTPEPEATTPPPPIRVLHVVGNLTLAGGAQRQVLEVCRRLPQDRFQSEVVDLLGDGGLRPEFAALGIPVHDHTARAWDPLGTVRTKRLVRRGRFNVVHAHLSRGEIVARGALRGSDVPFVAHKYNVDVWWKRRSLSWTHRWVTARANVIVVPSPRVADFYRDPALRVAAGAHFEIIPFGRVTGQPPPRPEARARVLAELGLDDEQAVVLAAGRLVEQKRHDLLLEAFAVVRHSHPEAHLAIAGVGELEDGLRRRAASDDLAGRVHFIGLRTDLMVWLAGADLFVNSSDWEGLPLVVLDAMAARIPIVATAVAAVPDCIIDGETGRLVPAGEPGPLARAITEILADPDTGRRWTAAAARRVDEVFGIESASERWANLYEQLAGGRD